MSYVAPGLYNFTAEALIPLLDQNFDEDVTENVLGNLENDYPTSFEEGAGLLLKAEVVVKRISDDAVSEWLARRVRDFQIQYFIIGVDNLWFTT